MITKNMKIEISTGLEARPVAVFVQVASQFESSIYVEVGNKKVNAKSIMGMMTASCSGVRLWACTISQISLFSCSWYFLSHSFLRSSHSSRFLRAFSRSAAIFSSFKLISYPFRANKRPIFIEFFPCSSSAAASRSSQWKHRKLVSHSGSSSRCRHKCPHGMRRWYCRFSGRRSGLRALLHSSG